MRQNTLDILDSFIRDEYAPLKTMSIDKLRKLLSRNFFLTTPHWDSYVTEISKRSLVWKEFKYTDISSGGKKIDDHIKTDATGLYLFVVRPNSLIDFMPQFVLYVGISGATPSSRPLRKRLTDYFRVNDIKKRDAIRVLIQYYYEHLYIKYAEYVATPEELQKVENQLIGLFFTEANKDDFPPELQPARKAY